MLRRNRYTRMDDQRKDHPDPKRYIKRNHPQQLQIHNVQPMMWKILTKLAEIYYSLINRDCSPKNRKDAAREEEEQKIFDTLINTSSRIAKRDEKNLSIAWIDDKRSYNIVPQAWIIDCQKLYKISDEVITSSGKRRKTGEWNWQQGVNA